MENNITLDQALQAEKYVDEYIKFNGGDPDADGAKDKPEKFWPEDVKKAWETADLFWQKMDDEGRLP